ncbi:MAG: sugar phosphate isomerase/epimerase [Armatimonadetes bacterium]|nr:sugar phosphate isomerase/epimerase [Armatimonadota bacterium]
MPLDRIEEVQNAGFDYIELPVATVKPESPDSEFEPVRDRVRQFEIVPLAWNCLLPPDIKVVGPEVDIYRIERYLRNAFHRIEELGGEIVVFGSGGARKIPDGFPSDEAGEQLVDFLTICGQVAGIHGITVAIEPLNRSETNTINSVKEGLELVKAVDHPFVKLLVDFYHIMVENEPLESILEAGDEIVHVHTADTNRHFPGSGSYPYARFFEILKEIGYQEGVSAECGWSDFFVDSVKALEFLRSFDS